MIKSRTSILIISTLLLFIIFLSQCMNGPEPFSDLRGRSYAGAASCRQCHRAIYDSALLSAHFNATAEATSKNIQGSFKNGANTFVYNDSTKIVMENRDSGFYQVLYINGKAKEARRFDISFGERHAQTWLYWMDGRTYELPVSFYTSVHNWATSPGFSATQPNFRRLIGRDCFECHSSNITTRLNASTAGITEVLVKSSLLYGIDCERCHGPAANHVNYHLQYPEVRTAKYIVTKDSLSQQQQLDMCALCHSGNDKLKLESRFKFRPGNSLVDFFASSTSQANATGFDVHGNQYRLLEESKCFVMGKSMTCATCHNPHENATTDLAIYSQKCMSCHNDANHNFCSMAAELGDAIKTNCIDCHMPKKPSEAISFQLAGRDENSSYLLRTHRIAIYNQEKNK